MKLEGRRTRPYTLCDPELGKSQLTRTLGVGPCARPELPDAELEVTALEEVFRCRHSRPPRRLRYCADRGGGRTARNRMVL